MRFYQRQHAFYCGVDLHAKTMHICLVNQAGEVLVHTNIDTRPDYLLNALGLYRKQDLVIAAECMFAWYWLADFCAQHKITFVLGHALYMKAIHGGKSKTDKIDSQKIALMLRGGMLPQAYVYPPAMRATRDLLRRRTRLVRIRAEALSHVKNTITQYNMPPLGQRLSSAANRVGVAEQFNDPSARQSIAADLSLIDHLDQQISQMESHLVRHAKVDDPQTYARLQTIPGVGKIIGLLILYEVCDIERFSAVGKFVSYARLVRCSHESAGKKSPGQGTKIGNAHLKWAFSEAAVLMLANLPQAASFVTRKAKLHGKGKAISILAARLGRVVYYMLKRKEDFNVQRMFGA